MDKEQLKHELDFLKIDPRMYNLEGSICKTGTILYKSQNTWEVIHIGDKGEQKIAEIFNSENDACLYILDEFTEYKKILDSDFKPQSSKTGKNIGDLPDVINL